MGKRFLIFLGLLMLSSIIRLSAQYKFTLPGYSHYSLDYENGILEGHLSLDHFNYFLLSTDSANILDIYMDGFHDPFEAGAFELPVFSKLLELSDFSTHRIKISTLDSTIIDLATEFPGFQIPRKKEGSIKSNSQLVQHSEKEIRLSPEVSSLLERESSGLIYLFPEGKMRGLQLGRLEIRPFRYDSLNRHLIIYNNIKFSIIPGVYAESRFQGLQSFDWERSLSGIVKLEASQQKKLLKKQPMSMVILSDSVFQKSLQPLIKWKKQKGFRIIEAYVGNQNVGETNTEIRAYMKGIYQHPPEGIAPPSYLMIVGDVEHVPLSQSSGQVTDLYYTTYDGADDYLPEIFHGRVSVKDTTELNAVIDKILMYEKFHMPDPSYLDTSILIAGYDASYASLHGNGQIRYANSYYFNEANGIEALVYLHPEASSQDSEILNNISNGAAVVNYTGHGDKDGWLNPSFNRDNVANLGNQFKYALMIGNGCKTNQFNLSSQDCFAEAVVKVPERGAIGYIGCTNDSYWDEDYYWAVGVGEIVRYPVYNGSGSGFYDKIFHIYNEPVAEWAPSMGEMIFAGNMTVQESNSMRKKYYWEIYQITGDPSLVPWLKMPAEMKAVYPEIIPNSARQLNFETEAYDYIALSCDDHLIDAKHADKNGHANFLLPDTLTGKDLYLVITGDRRQPVIDSIKRQDIDAPYLELLSGDIFEDSNSDNRLSGGESFSMNLQLLNRGNASIEDAQLVLEPFDSMVNIIDSTLSISNLSAGDTLNIADAFKIELSKVISDSTELLFKLKAVNENQFNNLFIEFLVHAPEIVSKSIIWDDAKYGNADGKINDGEELLLKWKILNSGSYPLITEDFNLHASTEDNFSSLTYPDSISLNSLEATDLPILVKITEDAHLASDHINLGFTEGNVDPFDSIFIALKRHFEDFSRGNLSRFLWLSPEIAWSIDSVQFETGPFSLRSGYINDTDTSLLSISFELPSKDSMSFYLKTSTEEDYDFLILYVDSLEVQRWSGETAWSNYSFELTEGSHIIEWQYIKDQSLSKGEDAVWIDNVVFPADAFSSTDMAITGLNSPTTGSDLEVVDEVHLQLSNTGKSVIDSFQVIYRMDTLPETSVLIKEQFQVGEEKDIIFVSDLDMSVPGTYDLIFRIHVANDKYPGNDSASFVIEHTTFSKFILESVGIRSDSVSFAIIELELTNAGSDPESDCSYSYYLNGAYVSTISLDIDLNVGETISFEHILSAVPDSMLIQGINTFALIPYNDSLSPSDAVSGQFFWGPSSRSENAVTGYQLYPNPAGDFINISIDAAVEWPLNIQLVSLEGKILKTVILYGQHSIIDLHDITEGQLLLMVIRNKHREVVYSDKIRLEERIH